MKSYILLLTTVLLLISQPLLADEDMHSHGIGDLNVIITKSSQLHFELDTPSHNLLGFEHPPRSKKEKKQLKKLLNLLEKPYKIIRISSRDQCTIKKIDIENPFTKNEDHEEEDEDHGDEDHDHGDEDEVHTDFIVRYQYQCDSPPLKINLKKFFSKFKFFEELKVAWVYNKQQGSKDLSKKDYIISFE